MAARGLDVDDLTHVINFGFEAWQDIPGYEGLYQASTYGRIKSLPRKGTVGRILKAGKDDNGYLYVVLGKDGKNTYFSVTRQCLYGMDQ